MSYTNSPIIHQIQASTALLRYLAARSRWQEAFEAASTAIRLIPQLVLRSLGNSDKQHWLGQLGNLSCEAASVALLAGHGPLTALNFLEQGRGILTTSIEGMQSDISELERKYPALAERFARVRDELEHFTAPELNRRNVDLTVSDQQSNPDEYFTQLIAEIHTKPGFEDFLLPPSASEIRNAGQYGPIVVINISLQRCFAIIVDQHSERLVTLDKFNKEELNSKSLKGNLGSRENLEWL